MDQSSQSSPALPLISFTQNSISIATSYEDASSSSDIELLMPSTPSKSTSVVTSPVDTLSSSIMVPSASSIERSVRVPTPEKDRSLQSTMTAPSRRCKSWMDTVDSLTVSAVDIFENLRNRNETPPKTILCTRELLDELHKLRGRWNKESLYNTTDTYNPNNPHLPQTDQYSLHKKIAIPKSSVKFHYNNFMAATFEVFDDLYDRANTPVRARELHNALYYLRKAWDDRDSKEYSTLHAAARRPAN